MIGICLDLPLAGCFQERTERIKASFPQQYLAVRFLDKPYCNSTFKKKKDYPLHSIHFLDLKLALQTQNYWWVPHILYQTVTSRFDGLTFFLNL